MGNAGLKRRGVWLGAAALCACVGVDELPTCILKVT